MNRKWYNEGRYERECQEWCDRQWPNSDPDLQSGGYDTVRAITESGIHIRVRCYTTHPGYYGTFTLT